jgi:hypothetical protein
MNFKLTGAGGAMLLGFTVFAIACGSPNVTRGTVIEVKHDPAHATTERDCKRKAGARCVQWGTKPGWDDADYEIKIKAGSHTSWIEVDNPDIYQACPVGLEYPDCANEKG